MLVTHQTVLYLYLLYIPRFIENPFRGFGTTWGRNWAFHMTSDIGLVIANVVKKTMETFSILSTKAKRMEQIFTSDTASVPCSSSNSCSYFHGLLFTVLWMHLSISSFLFLPWSYAHCAAY